MKRLEDRWDRRFEDLEDLVLQRDLDVPAAAQAVWTYLVSPAAVPLLVSSVTEAFELPTSRSNEANARWCLLAEKEGTTSAHVQELVEQRPGEYVTFRWVTGAFPVVEKLVLEPAGPSATRVIYRLVARVPDGSADGLRKVFEPEMTDYLRRLRSLCVSGLTLPPSPSTGTAEAE